MSPASSSAGRSRPLMCRRMNPPRPSLNGTVLTARPYPRLPKSGFACWAAGSSITRISRSEISRFGPVHFDGPDFHVRARGRPGTGERFLRDEPVDTAVDGDEGPDVVDHAVDDSGEDLPRRELLLQRGPGIFLACHERVGDPAVDGVDDECSLDPVADLQPAGHVRNHPGHLDVNVAEHHRGSGRVVHAHDDVLTLNPGPRLQARSLRGQFQAVGGEPGLIRTTHQAQSPRHGARSS
jgi:hypothetical protein